MRTRTKPCFANSRSSFLYSPLRPRTTGDSTWMRVPSGSACTRSHICFTVCAWIGLPQFTQCGTPIRA